MVKSEQKLQMAVNAEQKMRGEKEIMEVKLNGTVASHVSIASKRVRIPAPANDQ